MTKKKKLKVNKPFKVPNRKHRVFRIFKWVLRKFIGKYEIINEAGDIPEKCLLVGNHAGKKGPLHYELYLPIYHAKWGAHEMLMGYASRFKYLKNVLYIQKLGMKKSKATRKALFEAIFSKRIYRGMKIMGTYPDARIMNTIRDSITALDANMALMIYPEDSSKGYDDAPKKFLPGFSFIAERYYKLRGEDLPVYSVYISVPNKKIIIGKDPVYINALKKEGLNREDIAEKLRTSVNDLYYKYIEEK